MGHAPGKPCPVCGGESRHVNRYADEASGDIVRRRYCLKCGYRFYTRQPVEEIIEDEVVTYPNELRKTKLVRLVPDV